MSTMPSPVPHYRIVRHAGTQPGWVVQLQDTDDTYLVSYWDGSRWTKVARQRPDGTTVDQVSLDGDTDDSMVVDALEVLEHRHEVRDTGHRAAPVSLVVGLAAGVGALISVLGGAPAWLVVGLAALGVVAFALAIRWAVQGRGRVVLSSERPHEHDRTHEVTGDLSENAMVGTELAVGLFAGVGAVAAIALIILVLLEVL